MYEFWVGSLCVNVIVFNSIRFWKFVSVEDFVCVSKELCIMFIIQNIMYSHVRFVVNLIQNYSYFQYVQHHNYVNKFVRKHVSIAFGVNQIL